VERLLEQVAERQPVYAGEAAEAFAGFLRDLDADLLTARRPYRRRALLGAVGTWRRLHWRSLLRAVDADRLPGEVAAGVEFN